MTNAQIAKEIADELCKDDGDWSKERIEKTVSTVLHRVLVAGSPRFRANDGGWQEW